MVASRLSCSLIPMKRIIKLSKIFKKKSWPLVFGLGSGFGMAYKECEQEMISENMPNE